MDEATLIRQSRLAGSVARYALAVTLLLAGCSKATDIPEFMDLLRAAISVSETTARFLALAITAGEISIGTGLLLSPFQDAFRRLGVLMLVTFTAYLASGYLRGEPAADCGCILFLSMPAGWAIVRNLALIGVCVMAELPGHVLVRRRGTGTGP